VVREHGRVITATGEKLPEDFVITKGSARTTGRDMTRAFAPLGLTIPLSLLTALAFGCDLEPDTGADTDTDGATSDTDETGPDPSGGGETDGSDETGEQGDCAPLTQEDIDGGSVGPGCYDVQTFLVVMNDLEVLPDTQLRFSEFSGLSVFTGGSLTVDGGAPDSVVFEALGGPWQGIEFAGSASPDNRLDGVSISGTEGDAVTLSSGSTLAISNSEIAGNGGYGVMAEYDTTLSLASSIVTDNLAPIELEMQSVEGIAGDNMLTGNDEDAVFVRGGTLAEDATWQDPGVPYRFDGVANFDGALALSAGITIEMPLDHEIYVSETGSISALGTAEAPITLRGHEDQPGYWQGLGVFSRASANHLDYTIIENGGSDAWTGASETVASVYLGEDSKLVVSNSTLRGSGGAGLMAENADNDISGLANNTFEGNAYPLAVTPDAAKDLDDSNTFMGNDEELVMVWPWSFSEEGMLSSGAWMNPGIPYRVASYLGVVGDWEIGAGVEIQCAQDVEIHIEPDASVSAMGTADAPIRFVGADALGGYWMGIGIHSVSSANVFENVEVLHAGSSNFSGADDTDAAVYVGNPDGAGRIDFRATTIADTDGFGIVIADEGTVVGCGSVTFSGNTKGDFSEVFGGQSDC